MNKTVTLRPAYLNSWCTQTTYVLLNNFTSYWIHYGIYFQYSYCFHLL